MSYRWKILLVEDLDVIAKQVEEAVDTFVDEPESAEIERVRSFKDGLARLNSARFDILILDLKDDNDKTLDDDDASAGLKIFDALKASHFAPVVFYTAHAHKVKHLESPFVRIVEKTQGVERLGVEIRSVMETRLPKLSRLIEDIQRDYMWDFVSKHFKEFDVPGHRADIAYLLARRLAATLEIQAATLAKHAGDDAVDIEGENVHPMQMYVFPNIEQIQGGDILAGKAVGREATWIVLTPTCDLVQCKAESILLARCTPLTEAVEFIAWTKDPTAANQRFLTDLIGDNRKAMSKTVKVQADRFKYLPGTFFVDDLVVDFQDVVTIEMKELATLTRIACLDSPFAEALLGRFNRYYSRIGTPDISKSAVLSRLATKAKLHAVIPGSTAPAAAKAG